MKIAAAVLGLVPAMAAGQALPFGTGFCDGVRPGALLETEDGALCTMNFIWTGGNRVFIGTAGHCALCDVFPCGGEVDNGEEVWTPGNGPEVLDVSGNRIGEFAYAIQVPEARDGIPQGDFALIRLDPGVVADTQMCHFGGPTGVNDDVGEGPVLVEHYGQGVGVGAVLPARTGLALGLSDPDVVRYLGVSVFGDSGAPVTSADGRALGVLSAGGAGVGFPPSYVGNIFVTRITPQVERAEERLGFDLTLETAPSL